MFGMPLIFYSSSSSSEIMFAYVIRDPRGYKTREKKTIIDFDVVDGYFFLLSSAFVKTKNTKQW